jgi:hypothetical protein
MPAAAAITATIKTNAIVGIVFTLLNVKVQIQRNAGDAAGQGVGNKTKSSSQHKRSRIGTHHRKDPSGARSALLFYLQGFHIKTGR